MEWYQIIISSIGIAGITAVPFINGIKTNIKENSDKFDAHVGNFQVYQLHIAEKYVTQEALRDHLERIEKGISEIKVIVNSSKQLK